MLRQVAMAMAMMGAAAAAADPVEGTWRTGADDNGHSGEVEIVPCGPAFCGTLRRAFDGAGAAIASPNIGRRIVWDMMPEGGGAYGSGKVWSPDRDRTYAAKMRLSGDSLAVSGCIWGFCRDGGRWARVR